MASGHKDADLPASTVHRSASFLADMLQWLQGSGFTAWTVQKEPGNHLCPYWVYCVLDPTCTAKSKVVFGATRYAAVNPNVHAYVRAKQKYLPQAFELLSSFIETWAAAHQPEPEPQHDPPEAPQQQWRQVLNVDRIQCAYTGFERISGKGFSFDVVLGSDVSTCNHWRSFSQDGRLIWITYVDRIFFFADTARLIEEF